jgi:Centromere DNA-binding protein complex CBF3 subunit, domain 2/Transcriptional activator of glycolytic enzymes
LHAFYPAAVYIFGRRFNFALMELTLTLYTLQIRRAGKWNDDIMTRIYLSSLPREYIRKVAGHPREGHYFVDRAQIQPPASLLSKVFPLVERDLGLYNDGTYESSLSGQGFLRLLRYLKTVFLQDSVILREQWPEHPNFQDPLFKTEEYQTFAAEVLAACGNPVVTHSEHLHQAVPEVVLELDAVRREFASLSHSLSHTVQHRFERTHRQQQHLEETQHTMQQELERMRRQLQYLEEMLAAYIQHEPHQPPPGPTTTTALARPAPAPAAPAAPASTAPAATVPATIATSTATTTATATATPRFIMDRSASKVPDIWWEWHEGRGGKPSVLSLNDRYGSDWRKGDKNAYSRRKKLIDEIDYVASTQNRDPLEVVHSFEEERVAKSKSLNWMWETWVPQQKAARGG